MPDLRPGDTLADRFEVVGILGRGGTATVYLAHDRLRDGRVAIKVLHDHLAHDPSMRRRLRREVTAAGLVRHDAALVAYDLHVLDGSLALSMPFHPGTTLTERVRAEGPLTPDEVRHLGLRLSGALADAHRRGVLHRDVTPNNVMLGASPDDAVLTDFGLARTQDGTATATSVLGTPGYAAPEVYSGQRTDPRSDLYGLGAVLYFAATGRSPHGVGSPAAILKHQISEDPEPLATACPGLPADLAGTIEALLSRSPERRPPSAREVAEALTAATPAMVPEVPDTWDPSAEPLVPPESLREPAPRVPAPVPRELPAGSWDVIVKGRRRGDARALADHVGRVVDLPPGALEVTRTMRTRKHAFRLTRSTDRDTAQRLSEAAQFAGYQARIVDARPPGPAARLASVVPLLIPVIWVAFPFWTLPNLGLGQALFLSIAATLLLPALASTFTRHSAHRDLPLALSGDLRSHVVVPEAAGEAPDLGALIDQLGLPDFLEDIARKVTDEGDVRRWVTNLRDKFTPEDTGEHPPWHPSRHRGEFDAEAATAQPTPQPAAPPEDPIPPPPQPPSRAEDLRGRALGNLDLLAEALDQVTIPEPARVDLARTTHEIRQRAVDLARAAVGFEVALASTPEPADTSWVHGRLTRLATLERAGDAVDPAERQRLEAAMESAEAESAAREEIESHLTSTLAQLLEIGATATRARAELLADADVPQTARVLVRRLEREVRSVDETRRELGARRQAAR